MNLLKRHLENRNGFTMIEAVLAIVLMGILAVAAMPAFDSMGNISLDSASRKILTDIRYAQNLATTTMETYGFRITGATTYEVYNVDTGDIAINPITNETLSFDISSDFKGAEFTTTSLDIQFNSYGSPIVGGGSNIALACDGNTKTISVSNSSGFVGLN